MSLLRKVLTSEHWHARFPSSDVYINDRQGTVRLLSNQTRYSFYVIREGIVGINNFLPSKTIRAFFDYWLDLEESIYFVDGMRKICVSPKNNWLIHRLLTEGLTLFFDDSGTDLKTKVIEEIPIQILDHPQLHHKFEYYLSRKGLGWELIKRTSAYTTQKTNSSIKTEFYQLHHEEDWNAYLVKAERARKNEGDWLIRVRNALRDEGKDGMIRNSKLIFTLNDAMHYVYASFSEMEDDYHVFLRGPYTSHYLPLTKRDLDCHDNLPETLKRYILEMERTERYVKRLDQKG